MTRAPRSRSGTRAKVSRRWGGMGRSSKRNHWRNLGFAESRSRHTVCTCAPPVNKFALVVGVLLFAVGCQKKVEVAKSDGKFDDAALHNRMIAIEGDNYSEFLDLREIFVGDELYGSYVAEAVDGQPQKYAAYLFYYPGSEGPATSTFDINVYPEGIEVEGTNDPVVLLYKLEGDRLAKVDNGGPGDSEHIDDIVLEQAGIYFIVVAEFDLNPGNFYISLEECQDCNAPFCGNSQVDEGEDCDDGASDTASCDYDCSFASCGDSYTNTAHEEACDTGGIDTAECNGTLCTLAGCGDFYTNGAAGEDCDEGAADNVNCDSDCTNPSCGDSHTNTFAGETCDDGGETAGCDDDCSAPSCPDGNWNAAAGEQCDDGDDSNPGDGCHECVLQLTSVQYLIPIGQLVNQNGMCTATNRHNQSNDLPFGFTWTDTAPFTPQAMTVQLSMGVMCPSSGGTANRPTSLNTVSTGSHDLTTPAACSCAAAPTVTTLNIDPTAYNVGGTNTFLIHAGTQNEGLATHASLGGNYARVTVYSAPLP